MSLSNTEDAVAPDAVLEPAASPQPEKSTTANVAAPSQLARHELQATFGNAMLAAAATGGSPPDSARVLPHQSAYGNAALAHRLIQRKANGNENSAAPNTPAPAQTNTQPTAQTALTPAPALIVEDSAETVQPGQMKKTAFLSQLHTAVCAAAVDAFAGTPWSATNCPYIEKWFAFYAKQDSQRLERTIRKYAPETSAVTSASELIPLITARVRRSLKTFVTTGEITGVPEGVDVGLPGGGMLGAIGGAMSGAMGRVGSALSGMTGLLFKEREGSGGGGGGVAETADPDEIQTQLGAGHSLEGSVRSRMESAYGQSFGDVQVHADSKAARLSDNLNARAFTVSQDIAFGAGEYQPGTLIGDALIAHELAHVMQQRGGDATAPAQKGTSDHDSFEEDADQAAVGAVVSSWSGKKKGLAKVSSRAMTSLKSGLRLQRCKADVAIPAEYEETPTIRPEDEELMQRLEGLHPVYAKYHAYEQAVKGQARMSAFAATSPMALGTGLGMTGHVNDLYVELENELHEEGFASVKEFETKIKQFEGFFQRYALQVAFEILGENEALIEGESKRYGGAATANSDLSALRAALAPAKEKFDAAARIPAVAKSEHDGLARAVVYYPAPEAYSLYQQGEQIARAMSPRFPILADPDLNIRALVAADDETLQSILLTTTSDRLSDIQKTRQNLANDPGLVWQMDVAVQRARNKLGIVQGSIYDSLIEHKLSEITIDKVFRSLVIGVLAIGLGVISAGTGTAAVLAAAALAGVSVGVFAAHTEEYLIQQAAAGTSFDRAKALTSVEPSLGWLALDLVGAILDLGAAISAFRGLTGTAKALAEGTATVNDLRQKALTIGQQLAKEKKIADPKVFADSVAAAAERAQQGKKLLAASPEAANAIRAAAAGLDETVVTGILRLSPEARAVVLTKFAGNAEVLTRLGVMAEQSEHVVSAVNLLRKNMDVKQFEAILGHYLKTRDLDSVAKMLRAIGEAGVDDDAIRAIAATMGKVKSEGGYVRKFTPQIHEAIAQKLGPGPEGLKKLLQVTEGLHPNQSGTIFELWATKYVYGGARERAIIDTSKLKGKYSRNPMSSDNWLSGSGTVVDFKHLRAGEKISGSAATQLEDYASLLKEGALYKGKTINHVEYLFSTLEAAQANASKIRGTLLENVTIKYIDPATGLPAILP